MKKIAILLCQCRSDKPPGRWSFYIDELVKKANCDLYVVDDLCAQALTGPSELNRLGSQYQSLRIFACQPRAVKHLLIQNQIAIHDYTVINLRDQPDRTSPDEFFTDSAGPGNHEYKQITSTLQVPSWYPVIDQERCTACGRCARYCLFGVYRIEGNRLTVQQPLNCKNNCPACARTCPSAAIIFPKYGEGGVIAGAEPTEQEHAPDAAPGNLSSRLAQRKRISASIFNPVLVEQAEKEKQNASSIRYIQPDDHD